MKPFTFSDITFHPQTISHVQVKESAKWIEGKRWFESGTLKPVWKLFVTTRAIQSVYKSGSDAQKYSWTVDTEEEAEQLRKQFVEKWTEAMK